MDSRVPEVLERRGVHLLIGARREEVSSLLRSARGVNAVSWRAVLPAQRRLLSPTSSLQPRRPLNVRRPSRRSSLKWSTNVRLRPPTARRASGVHCRPRLLLRLLVGASLPWRRVGRRRTKRQRRVQLRGHAARAAPQVSSGLLRWDLERVQLQPTLSDRTSSHLRCRLTSSRCIPSFGIHYTLLNTSTTLVLRLQVPVRLRNGEVVVEAAIPVSFPLLRAKECKKNALVHPHVSILPSNRVPLRLRVRRDPILFVSYVPTRRRRREKTHVLQGPNPPLTLATSSSNTRCQNRISNPPCRALVVVTAIASCPPPTRT